MSKKGSSKVELRGVATVLNARPLESVKDAAWRVMCDNANMQSVHNEVGRVLKIAKNEVLIECADRVMAILTVYEKSAERDKKTIEALRYELQVIKDFTKFLIQS